MSAPVAAPEEKSEENVRSFSIPKEVAVTENGVEEKNASNFGHSAVKTMWLVGDIVWSKIPGHPWWPSMVAYEPNTAAYFKYSGRTRYYHVQFFGHQPMRGWATEKSIVLYQGKEHFLSLHLSSHGVPAHRVGTKTMPLWETAMKMADRAVPLNRHERQLCFTFKYNIQPKEESPSEGGLFTDILNGFVKPKAVKNCGKSPATPKTGKRGKGKRSVGGTEVACVNKSMVVEDGVSKTTLKKAMTGESVTDVVDDLAANLNQVVQTSHLQDNSGKQGKNKRRQSPGVKSKQSPGGGSKQSPAGKSKQVQDTSVNEDTADMKMDIDSPTLKHKIKRANVNPICPITGKRKRGRPPKDAGLLNVNSVSPDCELSTSAKKPKTLHGAKGNDGKKPSTNNCNNEKPDNASDSNSIASTDLETKLDVSKGTSKAKECVCVVCERPDALVFCDGVCKNAYHSDCLGLSCAMPNKFLCDECISGNHTCFICKKTTDVVQCSEPNCGKFYHLDCIKTANIKVEGEEFMCPLHVCSVCGPGKGSSTKRRRLTSCTRCPTAYHAVTCVVAGCLPITPYHLVCKRHFLADKRKAHHSHVNVNWCFVCSIGGTLICCESCPAAFHPECIDVPGIPEGNFFCRDCDSGKELLYGEIVWVKLGMYRWWPAKICNPNNIPNNIQNLHHQPGEFPVQFLGSHDYYWIHRGRVFCYQEGDKGSCTTGGKYLGTIFKKALEEAKEKYAEWQKAQDEKVEKLAKKPAQYKHLKVNRYTTATRFVVEESEWSACECSVDDENPCGPESHCLNRILFLECSPLKCPGKEKCQNQCFVKRQYLDCEPFKTPKCGWGLKAKEDAKKGRFVIEYVGELINDVTCRERVTKGSDEGVDNYYMLTIDKDCIVDAGPMGNLSRFMNHSCNPNCETQKWNVNGEMRVGLFAKHDIVAGEELLFDYQLDCLGNEKKKCGCGASNCSGFLGVRPKTQHAQLQEDKKKKMDLKKKKKKSKKSLVKNGSSPRNRRRSLPGQQPNTEVHLDITPEAFPASQLEVEGNAVVIEKVLTSVNTDKDYLNKFKFKPEQSRLNQDNEAIMLNQPNVTQPVVTQPVLTTPILNQPILTQPIMNQLAITQNLSQDNSQMLLDTSSTLPSPLSILSGRLNYSSPNMAVTGHLAFDRLPSFLLDTPPKPRVSPVTTPNQYGHDGASPSTPTSPSISTVSQFAPKHLPPVTHAFHDIGRGFQVNRLNASSTALYPRFNRPSVVSTNAQSPGNSDGTMTSSSAPPLTNAVWSLQGSYPTSLRTAVDESKQISFPWGYESPSS